MIPAGYTLLTPENARVGLQFTKKGLTYTITDISGLFIKVRESSRTAFKIDIPNKFVRTADLTPTPIATAVPSGKYVYRVNPSYNGERPNGFSPQGHMDYMLDPNWRYYSDTRIDLSQPFTILNTVTPDKNRDTWNMTPGHFILVAISDATEEVFATNFATDVPSKPVMTWSLTRNTKVHFIHNYLSSQIRTRYAEMRDVSPLRNNSVIDSFMPSALLNHRLETRSVRSTFNNAHNYFTISPWYADMTSSQAIPASELCRVLGYSTKMLKTLMLKVKRKKNTVSFIGYGGTNINTIYWLSEITKLTGVYNLFARVHIYERESIEISNLLRFPKHPAKAKEHYGINKLSLLDDELSYICKPYNYEIQTTYFELMYNMDLNSNNECRSPNHVFYGAPGLEARIMLSKIGRFISATHGASECSLHLNPAQDTQLQVESYGVIQLNTFFMNQLRMAIGFLEILASDQDLTEQDKELMSFAFDGVSKLKTLKKYNFHVQGTSNLAQQ